MHDEKNYSLVYFGAGWDMKPLNDESYKKITNFIFIDALQDSNYYDRKCAGYQKSNDKDTFMSTINKNL